MWDTWHITGAEKRIVFFLLIPCPLLLSPPSPPVFKQGRKKQGISCGPVPSSLESSLEYLVWEKPHLWPPPKSHLQLLSCSVIHNVWDTGTPCSPILPALPALRALSWSATSTGKHSSGEAAIFSWWLKVISTFQEAWDEIRGQLGSTLRLATVKMHFR